MTINSFKGRIVRIAQAPFKCWEPSVIKTAITTAVSGPVQCPVTRFTMTRSVVHEVRGLPRRDIKGFIPPKLPKLDLTTDTEYGANSVNVNMWL